MSTSDLATLKAVREQIAAGKITAMTFWRTNSEWQVNVQRPGGAWAVTFDADPFQALAVTMKTAPANIGLSATADDFTDLLG